MNCYRNFMWIAQSYLGDRLFGHFKGTPAIICGAGPSLEKNGPLLREFEGRALIFAGGSSINILNRLGVQPHFCAGIDPNEAQQVRLRSNQAFEVPYFYRQRLNYSAFRTVHAPLLYVTGSGGYDIAEYLEESLDIPTTPFEEGHNVINFAMELAYQMGCNPILFVGMDLAFTDCKTYSAGVTFDIDLEKRSLDQYANFETAGLKRQDIDGKPIYTLWKWVAESEWIGAWAKEHPDCSLINCTEGGIGFPGVAMQTLKEAALGLLGGQWDLHGQIHTEIQNAKMPQVTEERVEAVVRELRQSLSRCSQNIDFLDEDLERIKKLTQREMRPFPHAQSGKAALVELELSEEPAWRAVLDIFNQVSARLLNKELVQIRYSEEELPEWQKNIQRMEIMQKRLRFLRNVSTVNAEIIDYAVAEHAKEREFPKTMSREVMELFPLSKDRQFSCSIDKQSFHRDGAWRVYYDSGALKGVSHYNAGVLQGVSQFFTEQGQLLSNSYFQYGQRQGEQLCYYASGALYSRQQFEQGRPHGQQLYYYENGKLRTVLEYVQGQLVGEALLYNEQGDLKRHIAFNTNHSE